jgi:SET domain-containing protein
MVVVAARDIFPGEEVTLSYTPPLTSTPVRQVSSLNARPAYEK